MSDVAVSSVYALRDFKRSLPAVPQLMFNFLIDAFRFVCFQENFVCGIRLSSVPWCVLSALLYITAHCGSTEDIISIQDGHAKVCRNEQRRATRESW